MKTLWDIDLITSVELDDYDCTLTSREVTGSLQKAIGEAMIAIDKAMLGEFYTVRQEIKANQVALIALGTREGYPKQPRRIDAIITRRR